MTHLHRAYRSLRAEATGAIANAVTVDVLRHEFGNASDQRPHRVVETSRSNDRV